VLELGTVQFVRSGIQKLGSVDTVMNIKLVKIETVRFCCRKCNTFVSAKDTFCKRCKTPIEWDQFLNPNPVLTLG